MRRGKPLAFGVAVGALSLTSMFLLNVAADRIPSAGLRQFRDFIVRRNG